MFSSLGLHKDALGGCNTSSIRFVSVKAIVFNCKSPGPWRGSWMFLSQRWETGSKHNASQISGKHQQVIPLLCIVSRDALGDCFPPQWVYRKSQCMIQTE